MVELRSMQPLVKWSDQERRPSAGRCTQIFPVGLWTKGLKPSVATTVADFLETPHANSRKTANLLMLNHDLWLPDFFVNNP